MFGALGSFVTRFRWYVIAAWVLIAVVVATIAPALQSTQDNAEFLPDHYESIKAANLQSEQFSDSFTPGAILVVQRQDGGKLTAADQKAAVDIAGKLGPVLGKKTFQPTVLMTDEKGDPNVSEDGTVMFGIVPLAKDATGYDPQAYDDADAMRDDIADLTDGTDLQIQTTGTVPQGLDSQESGDKTLLIVGIATVVLIIGLLALIFRSVLICLLPILTVALVSTIATGAIAWANDIFDLKADSSVQQILVVVLYGVGTDYILFFLFRHRERLREGAEVRDAVVHSLDRAGEAIASAGGAVIVSFMALVLSSLSIFRAIGPALAIAVFVTLLAALTLVPALATVFGRQLFAPSAWWRHGILIVVAVIAVAVGVVTPLVSDSDFNLAGILAPIVVLAAVLELVPFLWGRLSRGQRSWDEEPEHAAFNRLGDAVGKRPVLIALVSGGVMTVIALFALGFNPSFDFNSSLPDGVESTEALNTFQDHFAKGSADPVPVLVDAKDTQLAPADLDGFKDALGEAPGVAKVDGPIPSKDGSAYQYFLTLTDDPTSDAAQDNVAGPIRDAAHEAAPHGTEAYVGGTPGIFADMSTAMARDYKVVFPVAAIVIMLILALLLRSLVAPWYLMAAVGLGFAASLGATVIAFQHIGGEPGLIFMLPIYIYLFVTALGTDYNILMIARLREEAREGRDPRQAASWAVRHAGPTIAAAGVILAGTFASLMLGGNTLIVSMGFALSIGIVLAAFVMALFFTPSLTALIGHAAWWPGHGDETAEEHEARVHGGA